MASSVLSITAARAPAIIGASAARTFSATSERVPHFKLTLHKMETAAGQPKTTRRGVFSMTATPLPVVPQSTSRAATQEDVTLTIPDQGIAGTFVSDSGLMVLAAAKAAAAPAAVTVSVDINKLIDQAVGGISFFHDQNVDRGRATQAIVDVLLQSIPNMNCMVVHSAHLQQFNGATHHHIELPQTFGTIGFEIYVFEDGTFTLLGDGGFQNWCFGGNFKRDGGKVQFFKR